MDLRDFYDRYWQAPCQRDGSQDPARRARGARLKRALARLEAGSVVGDVGCGTGEFTRLVAEWGFEAYGCDVAAEAVTLAREHWPEVDFATCRPDGGLPWADGFCDAVWCSEVLEHVFDVYGFMAELNRVIRDGGMLVLTTPYHGRLKSVLVSLLKFSAHFSPWISHIRFFDRRSLSEGLRLGGFSAERWSGVGRIWPLYRSFFVVARKVGPPGPRPDIVG
ncbi:MAG: hypothetical protein AMK73_01490 [Planctomycetes bacterium SM23_32]|nr:MAG: hypothetical protein AMK73_01490 [Planctomycetes bacterium SM23_32]